MAGYNGFDSLSGNRITGPPECIANWGNVNGLNIVIIIVFVRIFTNISNNIAKTAGPVICSKFVYSKRDFLEFEISSKIYARKKYARKGKIGNARKFWRKSKIITGN